MKDNERIEMVEQDNEMDSQVEKDQVDDGEVKEIEGGGDGKPRSKLDYQYSRDELMKYRNHPLSTLRPVIKDPNIDSLLCWSKPLGWTYVKRSDTPNDRGDDSFKRRPNDPRERVRKEQDGIVLSPQRRSFNSGCFVTVSPNGQNRSESGKDGPVRRIGSGRIINRDWEYRDKENADDGYPYRPSVGPSPRERDDRFDIRRNYPGMSTDREPTRDISRESLPRDKDPRVRDRDRLMSRFTVERRRFEPEEPEWFSGPPSPPMYGYCEIPVPPVVRRGPNFHVLRTVAWSPLQLPLPRPFRPPRLCVPYVKTFGGPTSQHDTIELRGFEDNEGGPRKTKHTSKASSKANSKDSKSSTGSRKSSAEEISGSKKGNKGTQKEVKPEPPAASSSPKVESLEKQKAEPNNAAKEEVGQTDNHDFLNLEDFLQLDNLPLLTNGGGGEGIQSSSRFSQWFRRDSPSEGIENRRSSIQDELIKNILNDSNKPSINIPTAKETDSYFAPISPAGTTSAGSLLELLQNNNQQQQQSEQQPSAVKAPTIKELEATGKVTSVEELEARMRQGVGQSPGSQSSQNHSKKGTSGRKEEELIAFKKLLKQVAEGGVTTASEPMNRSPASCLYQMLNKPPEPSDMMGQAHPQGSAAQMHVPQDLVYKLLHVQEQQRQQQEFNKLLLSSGRLAPPHVSNTLSPLSPELQMKVANSQPSAELLSRPEAQAILQGLRQGEITPQHLIQQLQNPAMQPRHREVLASILKLHGNSARPASPLMVPSDQALLQQLMLQQQLRNQNPLHNAVWHTSVITPNPLGTGAITLTLHHSGISHRVPSPRELMLHTQTIMQSALIKKKLEEQRENFRKRQEMQRATSPNLVAGAKSPNPATTPNSNFSLTNLINNNNNNNKITNINNNNSSVLTNNNLNASPTAATTTTTTRGNSSAAKSPTQLAFTPTSVLRKMTAEQQPPVKETDGNKMNKYNEFLQAKFQPQTPNELFKMHAAAAAAAQAQSSRFLANNQMLGLRTQQQQQQYQHQHHQQQQQQQQWNFQKSATLQQQLAQPLQQGRAIVKGNGNYAPAQPVGAGLVDLAFGNNTRAVFPQRSKLTIPTTPLAQPNVFNNFQTSANKVPSNRGLAQQLGSLFQSQSQPQSVNQYQSDVSLNATLQQLLLSPSLTQPINNNYRAGGNRNSFPQYLAGNGGEGDLSTSPTSSNQLSHWFTPELLAQAQAQTRSGKTDSLNMVSVEELERLQQSSAPVIN